MSSELLGPGSTLLRRETDRLTEALSGGEFPARWVSKRPVGETPVDGVQACYGQGGEYPGGRSASAELPQVGTRI
jgi:hypothetical protein